MFKRDGCLTVRAQTHQNINVILLQQHLRMATDTTILIQTVQNWLHAAGLYTLGPKVHVMLTVRHCGTSKKRATNHKNGRKNEWYNILFSDESCFSVHFYNKHIFIWKENSTRNNPVLVQEVSEN